ncbi:hypothetical protein HPB47_006038, partial [Ixodes persulcatus]
ATTVQNTDWLAEEGVPCRAWGAISFNIVAKSYKLTGISNKLDGTEDDLIWDRDAETSSEDECSTTD